MLAPLTRSPNFGVAFSNGWNVYKNNFGPIFLGSLIASLLGAVTCGICMAPLTCGLMMMILNFLRNSEPKPTAGKVMDGFQKFGPAFLTAIVIGLISGVVQSILAFIPFIGIVLGTVVSIALSAASSWALLLIADKNATFGEAIGTSVQLVTKGPFWGFVLVSFVAGLVGALGLVACGIGILFTLPLAICIVVAAYEEAYGSVATQG